MFTKELGYFVVIEKFSQIANATQYAIWNLNEKSVTRLFRYQQFDCGLMPSNASN